CVAAVTIGLISRGDTDGLCSRWYQQEGSHLVPAQFAIAAKLDGRRLSVRKNDRRRRPPATQSLEGNQTDAWVFGPPVRVPLLPHRTALRPRGGNDIHGNLMRRLRGISGHLGRDA